MDLREDVCPGSDGHSEGSEEWLHSGYNLSQLDLLMVGYKLLEKERHQNN